MEKPMRIGLFLMSVIVLMLSQLASAAEIELPANTWVQLQQDTLGARRGCALRFAPEADAFFLWGFMDADPEFRQEEPAMPLAEYDMVAIDLNHRRWQGHLPRPWEAEWSKRLPPTYVPRTYHGPTSGSERSLFRPPEGYPAEAARPDPNIVFDQVAYHPPTRCVLHRRPDGRLRRPRASLDQLGSGEFASTSARRRAGLPPPPQRTDPVWWRPRRRERP
jgi:hypothetical protein